MSKTNSVDKKIFQINFGLVGIALVLILVFIYGLKQIYSPDIGFHLAAGEWMVNHGEIMKNDVFTYTQFGDKYIDLNWFYQIIIYSVFNNFKSHGLVIFNAFLIAFSFLLLLSRIKTMMSPNYNLISFFMLVGIQALPMEIRPHVFSWVLLNLILYVLELYTFKKINRLYFLPIIMLFWINIHSLAILGLATISMFAVGSFLFNNYKVDKKLLVYLLISMAVFLINPYFIEGSLYPFQQFTLITGGFEKKYITELQSPFTLADLKADGFLAYLINPTFWLQILSAITIYASYKLIKLKEYAGLFICLGYLFILGLAVKNYGYFFFATMPYLLLCFQRLNVKENSTSKIKMESKRRVLNPLTKSYAICTISILLIVTTVTDGFSIIRKIPYRFGASFDHQILPVDATSFLTEKNLKGRVLNHLDFGGYLDKFYKAPIYIDGRLEVFGGGVFEEYFRSRVEDNGIQNLITKYNPDIVIFPYLKSTNWWTYFIQNQEWRPVFVDGLAAIYVRKNSYPQLATVNEEYFIKKVSKYDPNQLVSYINKPKANLLKSFFNSFVQQQNESIEYENLSMYCFTVGYTKAALAFSMANIDQSTEVSQTVYYNLYQYYSDIGDYGTANKCLKISNRKRK